MKKLFDIKDWLTLRGAFETACNMCAASEAEKQMLDGMFWDYKRANDFEGARSLVRSILGV